MEIIIKWLWIIIILISKHINQGVRCIFYHLCFNPSIWICWSINIYMKHGHNSIYFQYMSYSLKLTSGMLFWLKLFQRLALDRLKESILFNILYLIGCIPWLTSPSRKLGRPYVYSLTIILRCFIVSIWFRIDSNNALHTFLIMNCQYNHKLALACELYQLT
jgi:hypothetical protein